MSKKETMRFINRNYINDVAHPLSLILSEDRGDDFFLYVVLLLRNRKVAVGIFCTIGRERERVLAPYMYEFRINLGLIRA